jgi:hypothetical protein
MTLDQDTPHILRIVDEIREPAVRAPYAYHITILVTQLPQSRQSLGIDAECDSVRRARGSIEINR